MKKDLSFALRYFNSHLETSQLLQGSQGFLVVTTGSGDGPLGVGDERGEGGFGVIIGIGRSGGGDDFLFFGELFARLLCLHVAHRCWMLFSSP